MIDMNDFWDKLKYMFTNPLNFGEKIKNEKGIGKALLTYVIVAFFIAAMGFLMQMSLTWVMGSVSGNYFGYGIMGFMGGIGAAALALGILGTFIYSGLMHTIVIAFKGKGGFASTYNMFTYSIIPFILLSIVPYIGFLSLIYSFFIMIPGIASEHNLTKGKAAIVCLVPFGLFLGLLILLIIIVLSLVFGSIGL